MSSPLASALGRFKETPRRTAHQSVVAVLREVILSGAIAPGTRLIQAELAAQFGVSNTPVREALRELATEGLVQFDSYRGAVVRAPSVDEIREVYELSALLAPLSVRKAVETITKEELAALRRLHEQMGEADGIEQWAPLNREFHRIIDEAARSPRLAAILGALRDARMVEVAVAISAGAREIRQSNAEHARILRAIERGDAERAAGLMEKHVTSTLKAVDARRGV